MQSLRLVGPRSLILEESDIPSPVKGRIAVKVHYCGLCRTDAKMWQHGHRDLKLPRVLGHEIFGVASSGEPVAVWPGETCGTCRYCENGLENLCPNVSIMGFNCDGGLADYVSVAQSSILEVPRNLSPSLACLAEPLGCCLNAVHRSRVTAHERVLILGAGPVGLLMGMAVRSLGAEAFIYETSPEKLFRSSLFRKKLGISGRSEFPDGDFDVVINAASSLETFSEALPLTRSAGRYCLFSGLPDGTLVPSKVINDIHYRQLEVTGAYGCTRKNMAQALDMLDHYQAEAVLLIEAQISLGDVGFHLERIAHGESFKVVVRL
jgi:L-iditol 2-dehydrogenase